MKNNKLVKLISSFIVGVMFILAVLAVLIVTGVISFGKDDIVLKTGSKDALYDGSPLTNHEFEMVGELKDGHRIEYEFISSQTVVGESPNELQYKIFDELDADVTADYNIKHEYGTLKVNPRIVLVICEDTRGRIPRADEYYVDEEAYDGLVYDHKLVFREAIEESSSDESSTGEETTAQQSTSNKKRWKPVVFDRNNNDVTANYHIIVNMNVNQGGNNPEGSGTLDDEEMSVELDGEELAEKIFDSDTNLIPPVGNENTVLFSVKADNKSKLYLKMESFGEYNGQDWENARNYYHLIENMYSAAYLTATGLQATGAQSNNAWIISQCGKFALPYYLSPMSKTQLQPSDVVCEGNTDSEYTATYYFYSHSAKLPAMLAEYEAEYYEFVKEEYLTIDKTSLEFMNGIIEREGFDPADPQIINKVATYIQGTADYNLKYDRQLDKESNVAIAFLDDYREGVCSHYASAATLLYRALGIPARYTVGVVAYPNGENYVNVPAKNAHAWVEVYVEGLGWIYVEVTGVVAGNDVEVGQSPSGASECEIYGHDMRAIDAKDPECTKIGWTEHTACAREGCDYKEGYEEIDKLGHSKVPVREVPPQCIGYGNEAYTMCTRCSELWAEDGKTPIDEVTYYEPLGHDQVWFEAVAPDCVNEGHEAYVGCTRCSFLWMEDGETMIDAIPTIKPLGHVLESFERIAPDCLNSGTDAHCICSRCGWIFKDDGETRLYEIPVLSPLGHQKEHAPAKEPGCGIPGHEEYYECIRCGCLWAADEETPIDQIPVIAPLDHLRGNPDPNDHCNVYCERCGELIDLAQHPGTTYVDTEDGNKKKCTNCHDEIRKAEGEGEPNPNRVIYTVLTSTDTPIYLRESGLNYVGEGFLAAPEFWEVYGDTIPYSPNYLASLVAKNSGATSERIMILDSVDGGYGLPTYMWIGGDYAVQKNDVEYTGSLANAYTVPYYVYDFLNGNEPTAPSDPVYVELESVYRDFVYKTYLGGDNAAMTLGNSIVAEKGWSYDREAEYSDKIAVINSVASFVRGYREYDITYKAEAFSGVSDWSSVFFDKETYPDAKAVCRHYAASAIILYKALGIPARYASGVFVKGEAGEITDITEENRHAWVEVYMDGIGWIIVDPTGSAGFPGGGGGGGSDSKPVVTITVGNASTPYRDGDEITYESTNLGRVSGLPAGYSCEFKVIGWASEPGRQQVLQAYSVVILNEYGENVTSQFNVKKIKGYLQVYRDYLYFESSSYERIYNGKTPDEGSAWLTGGVMESGYTFTYTFTGNPGIGSFANSFNVKVWDGDEDVTDEYIIRTRPGEVTTTQRPITFTAGSAKKDYDGTPLICHEIIYNPSDLVEGHTLDLEKCEFEGEQTNPNKSGLANNKIIKVVIVNSDGEDVSDLYEKTYLPGSLWVVY